MLSGYFADFLSGIQGVVLHFSLMMNTYSAEMIRSVLKSSCHSTIDPQTMKRIKVLGINNRKRGRKGGRRCQRKTKPRSRSRSVIKNNNNTGITATLHQAEESGEDNNTDPPPVHKTRHLCAALLNVRSLCNKALKLNE